MSAARGGLGGVVPSRLQRRSEEDAGTHTREQANPPPPQCEGVSTAAALDAAMVSAGVFVLAAARRRACALGLSTAGLTTVDVADLAAFIASCEPDESRQRKYLAATLSDPERATEAVKDMQAWRNTRQEPQRRGPKQTAPWHDLETVDGRQREVWDHDRQCRIAYCRVVADRRTVQEVADELGVKTGTITAMIDRGRVLSGGEPGRPKRQPEGETQEQRTARFIASMRERRGVTA